MIFPAQRATNKDVLKQAVDSINTGGLLRGYEETLVGLWRSV